jgi:hypothetical protein
MTDANDYAWDDCGRQATIIVGEGIDEWFLLDDEGEEEAGQQLVEDYANWFWNNW